MRCAAPVVSGTTRGSSWLRARMLRRKGHHIVVEAVRRLKEMGLNDFLCIFLGEPEGRTRYSGEVWDLVQATQTTDVIRMMGPPDDMPAAYAAQSVVVSASTQPEVIAAGDP